MIIKSEIKQINDLADKVRKSDEVAFNKLFNLLWEPLFVFAQSIVMDEDKTKDLIQEVWIDYWNRRKKIENKNIRAYLYQAVRYKIYNYFRDYHFNNVQLEAIKDLPVNSEIEQQHNLENTQSLVNDSINDLPARCKEIFVLSRFDGINNEEIAKHLGVSKRTVENQISIALKKVRHDLQSTYYPYLSFHLLVLIYC